MFFSSLTLPKNGFFLDEISYFLYNEENGVMCEISIYVR